MKSEGMYLATVIFFMVPCFLLSAGLGGALKTGEVATKQNWRSYCLGLALIVAIFATVTAMGFVLSWTHNGGSPHGMTPQPGLWVTLRPVAMWSVAATVVLGVLGKGKGRLLIIGSAISILFVDLLLAMLEMD